MKKKNINLIDINFVGHTIRQDKEIKELTALLKEARDLLILCSLIDKSKTCDKLVDKIDSIMDGRWEK